MQLVELEVAAGFYTEQTPRGALNRWRDGDRVRFRYGLPEQLGGWIEYAPTFDSRRGVAVYFSLDASLSMDTITGNGQSRLQNMKTAINAALDYIETTLIDNDVSVDIGIRAWNDTNPPSDYTARLADAADITSAKAFVTAITTAFGTNFSDGVSGASTFFGSLSESDMYRVFFFVTDGDPEITGSETPAQKTALAEAAAATLFAGPAVESYGINIDLVDTQYTAILDNTPADAVPVVDGDDAAALTAIVNAIVGRTPLVVPPVRAMHEWSSLDNQQWLALASPSKLYVINNDILYDITPLADSGTLTDPFSTTDGSTTITVSHVNHGLNEGQYIFFPTTTDVGGIQVFGQYVVDTVVDLDSYTIESITSATSTETGGGVVDYEYEIAPPIGENGLFGWGIGPYGLDDDPNYIGTGYGTPRLAINLRPDLPMWSLDNWGEDLMAARRGGGLYIWERRNGANTRARIIPTAPVANNWIRVSPEDRHLISFGSHDGNQRDQSLIKWCAQEDYNDWTPSESNTAGDKRLDSGSRIITAIRTRGETIIFTDQSIYSMYFVGAPDIFEFQPKGESLSIVGPNAAVEAGGIIYFMAVDEFVAYDGVANIIPCSVRNYVFEDINRDEIERVYASVNKQESEVWWFYPSSGSEENDRYVVFNYREKLWYYGSMNRTAYIDVGFKQNPIAVDETGVLYLQESGITADGEALNSYAQTWDMEINNIGEFFGHINRFIPDFLTISGSINFTFKTKQYPTSAYLDKGPYTVDSTTRRVNFRARGRQVAIRIAGVDETSNWRHGTFRFEVTPDGKR